MIGAASMVGCVYVCYKQGLMCCLCVCCKQSLKCRLSVLQCAGGPQPIAPPSPPAPAAPKPTPPATRRARTRLPHGHSRPTETRQGQTNPLGATVHAQSRPHGETEVQEEEDLQPIRARYRNGPQKTTVAVMVWAGVEKVGTEEEETGSTRAKTWWP